MIELTIDDKAVQVTAGTSVLQAALANGIDIPHFCFHPCLSVAGNCRVCLVKVDGRPKLMPSCNLPVTVGMKIETSSDDVIEARRSVMQFITLNHPGDCGICDKAGECRVQDYFIKYGDPLLELSIEPHHHKPKLQNLSPRISLDNERCILCSRCVRFTHEISGSHTLGIIGRGGHSTVARVTSIPFDDPYSDNVIAICPTGALLSRDFLYKSRVWYLEAIKSVCTGCSRCCSVKVWRRKKQWYVRSLGDDKNRKAYRITPAENPDINGHWLCNKGFDLHKFIAATRVLHPRIKGIVATVDDTLAAVRKLLAEAKNPAALVSAHASNEELEIFKTTLGSRMQIYTREDYAPSADEVLQDDFLIRADKNPNSTGLHALFPRRTFDSSAGHDLLLVWGEQVDYSSLGSTTLIHLSSFVSEQERAADILIPISTTFERSGTFTNFEGKLNRFEKVFEKSAQVLHAGELFGRLAA
jgi:NADH-quinone oxidoreductase subunit G